MYSTPYLFQFLNKPTIPGIVRIKLYYCFLNDIIGVVYVVFLLKNEIDFLFIFLLQLVSVNIVLITKENL